MRQRENRICARQLRPSAEGRILLSVYFAKNEIKIVKFIWEIGRHFRRHVIRRHSSLSRSAFLSITFAVIVGDQLECCIWESFCKHGENLFVSLAKRWLCGNGTFAISWPVCWCPLHLHRISLIRIANRWMSTLANVWVFSGNIYDHLQTNQNKWKNDIHSEDQCHSERALCDTSREETSRLILANGGRTYLHI